MQTKSRYNDELNLFNSKNWLTCELTMLNLTRMRCTDHTSQMQTSQTTHSHTLHKIILHLSSLQPQICHISTETLCLRYYLHPFRRPLSSCCPKSPCVSCSCKRFYVTKTCDHGVLCVQSLIVV